MAPATTASGFYVPYDQIKPLYNVNNEPAKFLWQAFPWMRAFYTNYGACVAYGVGCRRSSLASRAPASVI